MAPIGYSGDRGKMVREENLKSKISCQTLSIWHVSGEEAKNLIRPSPSPHPKFMKTVNTVSQEDIHTQVARIIVPYPLRSNREEKD